MDNASSMLTQYDIEEVQEQCNKLYAQHEIVSLYKRFCQLDKNAKGFISADEFLSVPEFAMIPLSQIAGNGEWLEFQGLCCSFLCLQCKNNCIPEDWEDGKGNVTFSDIIEVLKDLTGPFMSHKQREVLDHESLKMEVEVPVD